MKHKTRQLVGWELDMAVSMADQVEEDIWDSDGVCYISGDEFSMPYEPSKCWWRAGQIIEREGIGLERVSAPDLYNEWGDQPPWPYPWRAKRGMVSVEGPTPLVAAMRLFVLIKLGEEVEL